MREASGSLPGSSSLTVDTGLPGLHLHLPPLPAPRLSVLDPEAGDLGLALAGPGQGVGVGVETDPGTGEGGRGGQTGHQDRRVAGPELVAGLTLVGPEHLLALQGHGQEVPVGLLSHLDVLHAVVQDDAVPGPDDRGPGGGVDHAVQLLLQPQPRVDLRDHGLHCRGVCNGNKVS